MPERGKITAQLTPEQSATFSQIIRELIRHENELINQRISWLVQSQGLSFAALAFAWEKAPVLAYPLAVLGTVTALSAWTATSLSNLAVGKLENQWRRSVPEDQRTINPVIGLSGKSIAEAEWLRPSTWLPRWTLLRPWTALPPLFIVVWCLLVIARLLSPAEPPPETRILFL